MQEVLIVDSYGLFFRSFYAAAGLQSKDGKPSSMVFGLSQFLLKLDEIKADFVIFALEGKDNFRKQIDPSYKANRSQAPDELRQQIPVCINMLKDAGLKCISVDGYEADDIIASLAKKLSDKYIVKIFSSDKDLYQLISPTCSLIDPKTSSRINSQACVDKFGLKPSQIKDYLAICGDSADNIKGVKGIGAKGAKDLLLAYNDIDGIYKNLELITNKRQQNALANAQKDLELSLKLVTLADHALDDMPTNEILSGAKFPEQNPLLLLENYLDEYSIRGIKSKLQKPSNEPSAKYITLDSAGLLSIIDSLNQDQIIGFDTETTGLSKDCKLVGFSFCLEPSTAYYVPIAHNDTDANISLDTARRAIARIFECFVVGHNLKFDFSVCMRELGISLPARYSDTMILAWLDDSTAKVGLDHLASTVLGMQPLLYEQIVPKGKHFGDIDIDTATAYAAKDAYATLALYMHYQKRLDAQLLEASKVECALIPALIHMEQAGVRVDTHSLERFTHELKTALATLEDEIYNIAQTMFNINSPKQLASVLFERLGLKSPTKKQSTDASALAKLDHPIIAHLLKYRELSKLIGTYCEPFLKLADSSQRIYTNFLQTRTATGRLASNEPNLQNLPAHGEYAKAYKSCFCAKDSFSLISLDYSQIELRLLAHFSREKTLVNAFLNAQDIHAQTAISIFGHSDEQNRRIAKSINFGLIYGMGYRKLSEELGIKAADAKEYIARYFEHFSGLEKFFESIKDGARRDGYTTTLLGRKRLFDYARATPMIAASYDRESVNSVLQGSAADIIKIAMIRIMPLLNDNAKMLLQIHDELIFEVRDDMVENFAKKAQQIMQEAYTLAVPLQTSLSIGKTWGELK